MSTRQSRTATKPQAAATQFAPWNMFADFSRQQATVAAEATGAMVRGFEAMGKIQRQAPKSPADWQGAARYWRDMAAAALEMQVEMMGCATHLVDSETALEAASAVEALDAFPLVKSFFPLPGGSRPASRRGNAN